MYKLWDNTQKKRWRFTQGGSSGINFRYQNKRITSTKDLELGCCEWLALPEDEPMNMKANTLSTTRLAYRGSTIVAIHPYKTQAVHEELGALFPERLNTGDENFIPVPVPPEVDHETWDRFLQFNIAVPMKTTSYKETKTFYHGSDLSTDFKLKQWSIRIPFLTPQESTPESLAGWVSRSLGLNPNYNQDVIVRSKSDALGFPISMNHDNDVLARIQEEVNKQVTNLVKWLVIDNYASTSKLDLYVHCVAVALDISLLHPAAVSTSMTSRGSGTSAAEVPASRPAAEIVIKNSIDFGILSAVVQHWHLAMDSIGRGLDLSSERPIQSVESALDFVPLSLSSLEAYATIYAQKRNGFMMPPCHLAQSAIQQSEAEAQAIQDVIRKPYDIYPRRLWDLQLNRVIPAYLVEFCLVRDQAGSNQLTLSLNKEFPDFVAISHSWRDTQDLQSLETPINQFAWPVPIPRELKLNDLREDLRRKFPRIRYCWLDVLCLRQVETRVRPNESTSHPFIELLGLGRDYTGDIRTEELRIDVPTIGNIYVKAKCIYRFFNGLGQEAVTSGWDESRHWMNRAWTLQENVPKRMVDGGLPSTGQHFYNVLVTRRGVTKRVREFITELSHAVSETSTSVIALAAEMGKRYAANEVDKIAGLSYLLRFPQLPTYSEDASVAHAWQRCVSNMNPILLAELFWNCPLPGAGVIWVPNWPGLQSCPPTFARYEPSSRQLPNDNVRAKLGELSWTNVTVLGIQDIQHVAEGDYLIDLILGNRALEGERADISVISKRFFISHDRLELDLSLLDFEGHGNRDGGVPVGFRPVAGSAGARGHPAKLKAVIATCILVSLDPIAIATEQCSTWVLLQFQHHPVRGWHKVSVLRTDEDLLDQGAVKIHTLERLELVGPSYGNIQIKPNPRSMEMLYTMDMLRNQARMGWRS